MTRTSLRAYIKEIESLINRGRYEESIAHCRHILGTYPKSIHTYRLLGKAFLEARRYTDAIDIFQRLLSSIPDDFVAHLGLSIIREDEGTLDAAIWHMERAFEIQPYNGAIQEELKRLYMSRDGSAPPRMRLTRGALARMYAKGHLHQQAIAEIRSTLAQDPQRLDQQALLATMYQQSGKPVEAAEIASKILRRLPYCLTANQILAQVLLESGKAEEARPYFGRLQALDPYYAYLTPDLPGVDLVPEGSVTIERIEIAPEQLSTVEQSSDWMSSLGLEVTEEEALFDEELPDWLISASEALGVTDQDTLPLTEAAEETGKTPAFLAEAGELEAELDTLDWVGDEDRAETQEVPEEPTEEVEGELPEWLSEAGWEAEEALKEGQDPTPHIEELIPSAEPDEELAEGEVPDWLKDLAPAEEAASDQTEDQALAALLGEATPASLEDEILAVAELAAGEQEVEPDWLSEFEADLAQRTSPQEQVIEEVELAEGAAEFEPEAGEGAPEAAMPAEELPEWLQEFEDEPEVTDAGEIEIPAAEVTLEGEGEAEEAELPEWLTELEVEEEAEAPVAELPVEGEAEEADVPEWLAELEVEEEAEAPVAELPVEGEAEEADVPEWLADLEVEEEAEAPVAELPVEGEAAEAELPEWLTELEVEEEAETPIAELPLEGEAEEAELPEWLADLEVEEEAEAPVAELPVEGEAEEAEVPEWLAELEVEEEAEKPVAELPVEGEAEEAELPEWLTELEVEEEAETPVAELPLESEAEEAELPEWLTELEVEEEAETPVAELPVEGEAEEAEVPEWLREFVDETPPETPAVELESPPDFADADEAMAWLAGLAAASGEAPPAEQVETDEMPEGEPVPSITAEQEQEPETEIPGEAETPEEEPTEDEPKKLKLLPGTDELAKTAVWEAPPEDEEGVELESPPDFADMDAAIAWLEGLAAKQGAKEEELFSTPEERGESAPDWVQQLIDHEPPPSEPEGEAEVSTPAPEAEQEEATAEVELEAEALEETLPIERLDLNTAALVELERLPGVGYRLAQSIIDYREERRGFQQLEDLLELEGIDADDLPSLARFLEVSRKPATAPAAEAPEPPPGEFQAATALQPAREALSAGDLPAALTAYQGLIRARVQLDDVIFDLNQALRNHPDSFELWQALGDAYLRDNQTEEAMQAYNRAEDLLY
jgi:competence ComEA-like helix-hairpin-helix protein